VVARLDQLRDQLISSGAGSPPNGFPRFPPFFEPIWHWRPGGFRPLRRCFGRVLLLILLLAPACQNSPEPESNPPDSIPVATTGVVDSILPVEEEIRRFRSQLQPPQVAVLDNGFETPELLVRQYLNALSERDTNRLNRLVIDAREFIDLYYPSSPYTRPPYRQNPSFVWFIIQQNSQKGMSRALARFGGRSVHYLGQDCRRAESQGANRFWECTVRVESDGKKQPPQRLFGSILERAGRYKFVSLASDL
jgi:hypothetical protein